MIYFESLAGDIDKIIERIDRGIVEYGGGSDDLGTERTPAGSIDLGGFILGSSHVLGVFPELWGNDNSTTSVLQPEPVFLIDSTDYPSPMKIWMNGKRNFLQEGYILKSYSDGTRDSIPGIFSPGQVFHPNGN